MRLILLLAALGCSHDDRPAQARRMVRSVAEKELARHRDGCPSSLPERDPWGHPFRYMCALDPSEDFIASDGPDGIPGNRDDITSRR